MSAIPTKANAATRRVGRNGPARRLAHMDAWIQEKLAVRDSPSTYKSLITVLSTIYNLVGGLDYRTGSMLHRKGRAIYGPNLWRRENLHKIRTLLYSTTQRL